MRNIVKPTVEKMALILLESEDIVTTFEDVRGKISDMLEDEQLYLISNIVKWRKEADHQSAYTIGAIISYREKKIDENYKRWYKNKGPESGSVPPKSLHEYWNKKYSEGAVPFNYTMAMRYKSVYEQSEPRIAEQLDVSKITALKAAPKEYRERLQEKAIEESWTVQKAKDEVKKIKARVEQKEQSEGIYDELPKFNVEVSGREVWIKFKSKHEAEAFVDVFYGLEPRIKLEMARKLKK